MPALSFGDSAARAECASGCVEPKVLGADGTSPLCKVMVAGNVVSGVYDSVRRTLTIPCPASTNLSDQPESVSALVCSYYPSIGAAPEYVVLLAPEDGATVLLPREGASNPSEIRIRPKPLSDKSSGVDGNVVAVARGPDPYAALLHATRLLADKTGAQCKDIQAYAVPLLDTVNRLRFDGPLAAAKSSVKLPSSASLASILEAQLHEGILVQAGPDCPAKPLLQAPGLRVCQGMSTPLGVRYSGMSVVYGTATGHVLAVMDTAVALKMAPLGGMRPLGLTSSGGVLGDAGSPSAVSAGASAANSAAPSPPMSRSNSGGVEAVTVDAVASLSNSPPGAAPRTPPVVLSGRSITAAPIIQLLAAALPCTGTKACHAGGLDGVGATPTGASTHVVASFALLGVKTSGGRVGSVQCCRIMPSSAALASASPRDDAAEVASAGPAGGLGVMVQVEVSCASAGTLLLFVEGRGLESAADPSREELGWGDDVEAGGPVRRVVAQGRAARWRYNSTGGILSVELPPAGASTGVAREVQIFM